MDTGVSVKTTETPELDEREASCRDLVARLLSRESERVRHARYVRELASETTKTLQSRR
jgi:hypothetical protein